MPVIVNRAPYGEQAYYAGMSFPEIVLIAGAIIFAGFGVLLLVAPGKMSAVDLSPASPNARAEIRAMYGGLEIAIAIFFWLTLKFDQVGTGLTGLTLALAGIAGGRIAGILLERGKVSRLIYFFAGIETLAAIIAYVALTKLE